MGEVFDLHFLLSHGACVAMVVHFRILFFYPAGRGCIVDFFPPPSFCRLLLLCLLSVFLKKFPTLISSP